MHNIDKLVVFIQAFTIENLHILEVYLADLLIQGGYGVMHLFPPGIDLPTAPDIRGLIREGENRGMRFVYCKTKDEYLHWLAKANLMITTAPSANSALLLEATSLGVTSLAPCCGDYPNLLPSTCLYRPFNLNHILHLASSHN